MDEHSLCASCLSLTGAEETFPFGPDIHVFKVGGKVFALVPVGGETSISLKCSPTLAEALRETYAAVTPGWHLNKRHWNTIRVDGTIPDNEVLDMISHSYDLIVSSLPKAQRKALGRS